MQTTKPSTAPLAYIVTRPFWREGKALAIGAHLELPAVLGRELETAGKVKPQPPAAQEPAPAAQAEPTPAAKPRKAKEA
jgi:hypothetical protein